MVVAGDQERGIDDDVTNPHGIRIDGEIEILDSITPYSRIDLRSLASSK
jgi:hypothetical protein